MTKGIGNKSPKRNTICKTMLQSVVEQKVKKKCSCTLYLIKFEVVQSVLRRLLQAFSVGEFKKQKLSYENVKLPMIWMHRSLGTCYSEFCDHLSSRSVSHLNLCIIQFKRAYLNVSVELFDSRQRMCPNVPERGVICLTPNYHNLTTFSRLKAVKLCTLSAQSMNS